MTLRLISFALCPYVHRSLIVLREKGAAFDVEYIELTNKPEWFLQISPRGKVPVLVVDGTPLFESAVINEFLDETIAPRLLPADPIARAKQRAWIEVTNDLFAAQYKTVSTAATKEEYESAKAQLDAVVARFEEAIAGDFFAGDAFGLVDAAAAPALFKMVLLEKRSGVRAFPGSPKVEAWARRLATRPSVVNGVRADFEEAYVASLRRRAGYFAREVLGPAAAAVDD